MAVTCGVLGPVVAERKGQPVQLGTVRQRALLAVLALEPRRVVPIDTLVDALWGDDPPARAEVSVRAYVSNLRRVLEPDRAPRTPPALLRTSGSGYSLDVPDGGVDALAFAADAGEAVLADQDGDWAGALAAADDALGRWRGPALVDVQSVPFALGATARLDGQRARVELIRLRALVELGRPAEALAGLEARVADDPLDEAATALLMRALYLLGRPSDALACFGALSALLVDQGLLPGPALQDLEGAMLRHDAALDPPTTPAVATRIRPPRPPAVVGRDDVWDALTAPGGGRSRWFVLAGDAGIGKTYLAEAVADAFGGAVAWGAARRDDDQPPLWLWQRALAGLDHDEPLAGEGTGIVAGIVAGRLRAAARRGPLLLVLDDVQWADSASLTVLGLVAAELRRDDVTALLTVRPSPEPALVDAALAEVLRQGGARRIDLAPLDVAATRALAATVDVALSDEAAVRLREAADGNPLLLRELLRLGPVPASGTRLPESIAALVAGRLDPLPAPTTKVLGLAALAGDDIDVELLAAVFSVPAGVVVERLRPAVRAALVADAPLRFRHATLRDVVLAGLDSAARRASHARIAAAMAGSDRWPAARLVHHLAAARPVVAVEQVVGAVRLAAEEAAAVGAFAEQARLLEVALADGALAAADRLALTVDAAEARVRAGQDVDAQRLVAAALDLARSRGDTAAAGGRRRPWPAAGALGTGCRSGSIRWTCWLSCTGRPPRPRRSAIGGRRRRSWPRRRWASPTAPTPASRAGWRPRRCGWPGPSPSPRPGPRRWWRRRGPGSARRRPRSCWAWPPSWPSWPPACPRSARRWPTLSGWRPRCGWGGSTRPPRRWRRARPRRAPTGSRRSRPRSPGAGRPCWRRRAAWPRATRRRRPPTSSTGGPRSTPPTSPAGWWRCTGLSNGATWPRPAPTPTVSPRWTTTASSTRPAPRWPRVGPAWTATPWRPGWRLCWTSRRRGTGSRGCGWSACSSPTSGWVT